MPIGEETLGWTNIKQTKPLRWIWNAKPLGETLRMFVWWLIHWRIVTELHISWNTCSLSRDSKCRWCFNPGKTTIFPYLRRRVWVLRSGTSATKTHRAIMCVLCNSFGCSKKAFDTLKKLTFLKFFVPFVRSLWRPVVVTLFSEPTPGVLSLQHNCV